MFAMLDVSEFRRRWIALKCFVLRNFGRFARWIDDQYARRHRGRLRLVHIEGRNGKEVPNAASSQHIRDEDRPHDDERKGLSTKNRHIIAQLTVRLDPLGEFFGRGPEHMTKDSPSNGVDRYGNG